MSQRAPSIATTRRRPLAPVLGCIGLLLAGHATARCPAPPATAGGVDNAHTRFVEHTLYPADATPGDAPSSLFGRMQTLGVPGVSVAVIHNGKIDWVRGWGVRDVGSCLPVTPYTAFQAASISKVVTAVIALRLVEQGTLSLDGDLRVAINGWSLPADGIDAPVLTLRGLLSHTAGLNVHGFPGYRVGTPLPTPLDVLGGRPPANTEAVRMVSAPGREWRYSGGGYVVAQRALEEATGVPFTRLAEQQVFAHIGMLRSAYAQPPTGGITADIALGHVDGQVIPGGYHVYPELAPAGLWTTPGDLARLLLDLQASARGHPSHLLSPRMTTTMFTAVTEGWGLGPALSGTGPDRRFSHGGVNAGFEGTMVAYIDQGEGVVVLTNGPGKRLADEIVRAIAADYGWNALASAATIEVDVRADVLQSLVGRYEGSGLQVYLDLREGHLFAQTGGPDPERLIALPADRFRTSVSGIVVDVVRARDGAVAGLRIVEGGPPITLSRTDTRAMNPSETPLFVRGSMNGWGTTTPLRTSTDGTLVAELTLAAGEHQLKIAAEDWRAIDLGQVGRTPMEEPFGELPLAPHGGNIRLHLASPATLRLSLMQSAGGATLTIRRVEGTAR